ncbi:MAG: DEAD/DEAH box helicase family protein, partial [Candidatus Omnitrophica bacterium]|nr:DEAD/DEAH box helicase family protein [Candidatus Omnitrophota bacterium]
GYSSACGNEWDRNLCRKPQIKCSECPHSKFLPLGNKVIFDHLSGRHMIGVYPLLKDETCWFLAIDFDKGEWQRHVEAFLKTCDMFEVPAALERSQSGNGAHIWFFFDQPIPAALARKLGCALITQTMNVHYRLGFDSYDRLFPSQDTMPKGGFGNLIALPLQGNRRKTGNSVFLDRRFQPYPDQWAFLGSLRKISYRDVDALVHRFSQNGGVIDIRRSQTDENEADPWMLLPSKKIQPLAITDPLPSSVKITLANLIYVENDSLPSQLLARLKKLAAFQNPEFYRAQAMRLSTYDKPRIIGCAEEFPRHLGLPRGCLSEVLNLFNGLNIRPEIVNECFSGEPIKVRFTGKLRSNQREAVRKLIKHDIGVLSATPAFGKTVVAAWMIAKRKVNTLVLVHRRQLMDQWKERLVMFLSVPRNKIGLIGAGKQKPTGIIDIAMLQTLFRKGEVKDLVANYGQVIVDECHHIAAFSFEQVMKQVKARYVLGLTATPTRQDGHHPIIMMQCGPIRFRSSAKDMIEEQPFKHVVKLRYTDFQMPFVEPHLHISRIYAALATDEKRNELIAQDILEVLQQGSVPLLLTERTKHVEYFREKLKPHVQTLIVLKGGMGRKEREAAAEQVKMSGNGGRMIIATGRYIGEGFDDARLDTLFLAMPISWHGTLQQYVGRLHRIHDHKHIIQVYDYVDRNVPVLFKMHQRRLKKYPAIGYSVEY